MQRVTIPLRKETAIVQALTKRSEVLERVCEQAHDAYERSAIEHGWVTQAASRVHWPDVPESNKRTMRGALKPLTDQIIDDMIAVVSNHLSINYAPGCVYCLGCKRKWPCKDVRLIIARLTSWGVLADGN